MDRWKETEVFVAVADHGTISKAAAALELSVSAASRYLAALEARLGVRLIQRTTRTLYLTDEGRRFLANAREVLGSMLEAEASVSAAVIRPTGTLRVTASLSFCLLHLNDVTAEFNAAYPEVNVDLVASNRYYDLIENGVDLAIRLRRIEADSSVTIRRLAGCRRLLAASPDYLARHGVPRHPAALSGHRLLIYTLADNAMRFDFTHRSGTALSVPVTPALSANDGQLLRAAALRGSGILAQPTYIIEDDLAAGRLVPLLDDWELPRLTLNMAFPTRSLLPAKTRLFMEMLVRRMQAGRCEERWTAPHPAPA